MRQPRSVFRIVLLMIGLLIHRSASAEVQTEVKSYEFNGVKLQGFLAWDDSISNKRPGVLVVHEWWGLNEYARRRAKELAEQGYVAFAVDMYGDGKTTEHPEDAGKMSGAVQKDQGILLGRARAGLAVLKSDPHVDTQRIAAIGYCFGGAVVLKLAYAGEDIAGVVSFHGSLPVPEDAKKIKAKILICHGAEDPFVSNETVEKVREALKQGGADYKIEIYPGAKHGFTVAEADKRGMKELSYNAEADRRSWQEMKSFFARIFK